MVGWFRVIKVSIKVLNYYQLHLWKSQTRSLQASPHRTYLQYNVEKKV